MFPPGTDFVLTHCDRHKDRLDARERWHIIISNEVTLVLAGVDATGV